MRHQLGTLALEAKFAVTAPWTVLFGPSGSGKSTVLRTIAGLVRPDAGRVEVLGEVVADRERGVWVPPDRRKIRWAGQRAALFPHRTVLRNLSMGTGFEGGLASAERAQFLHQALDAFGLRDLAEKRPRELSGGERQRVSVVRAAVGALRPRVLLLDEPFAGLDAEIRDGLIAALRSWLPGVPVISVTHDVGEAFLLGAEVVRISEGPGGGAGAGGRGAGAGEAAASGTSGLKGALTVSRRLSLRSSR